MKIKLGIHLGLLLVVASCNGAPKTEDEKLDSKENHPVADSSYSSFDKNSMTFTNVSYSSEEFDYQKRDQMFICKTTAISIGKSEGLRSYKEKREFYDLEMNKVFEIYAEQRTIELEDRFYRTNGLLKQYPRYFELNNYKTGKPFVKCTNALWTAEIPNSETVAYFGYRSNQNRRDTLTIGEYYFSINETKNAKLIVKAANKELRTRIYSNLPFRLESNNSNDKIFGQTTLMLWSKDGQEGVQRITDFNLIIRAPYDASDHDWNNNHSVEYKIPIVNGQLQADKISEDVYVFTINE